MRIPTEDLQKRIVDTIRYRFYDRLDLYDVYRWLDNFEDAEQEMAVSVFERLEYSQTGEKTGNDTGKDTGNEGTPDQYVFRLLEIVGNQTLTVKRMMEILKLKGDDNFRKTWDKPLSSNDDAGKEILLVAEKK